VNQHSDFRYAITIETHDLAVVYCLRALADYSQDTGNSRIAWGGTKDDTWKAGNDQVAFRFSRPTYRDEFVINARRLLPGAAWREVSRNDQDPARPQT
jgi:hypothetical protein